MTVTTAPATATPATLASPLSRFLARGLQWPLLVVVLLVIPVIAGGYLAYMANHDPAFATEPDYYRKAVAWDQTMAQERANAQLGWQAVVMATPTGSQVEVAVQVQDKSGAAVAGAKLHVEAFFVARANDVQSADAQLAADGRYHALLNLPHGGLHEFRVRAERGQQIFTATNRVDILPHPEKH